MSRHATLREAARWALRDDEATASAPLPPAGAEILETLDDPALDEALAQAGDFGRLSDGDVRAMRATRRRMLGAGGAMALLLLVGVGSWNRGWLAPDSVVTAHYQTQRGQRLDVALVDGSKITLNGATDLDVRLERGKRLVEMHHGQAYFDVAHDPSRPFAVHAAGSSAQVLGTAFDVEVGKSGVKLAVYRGRVHFGQNGGTDGVLVPAGWRSRFAEGTASVPERFDPSQQDWRQNWINTDAMTLEELIEALNRQGGSLIAPPPPALAHVALSGRFKLDDPHQLLSAIGSAYGFSVQRDGDGFKLIESGNQ